MSLYFTKIKSWKSKSALIFLIGWLINEKTGCPNLRNCVRIYDFLRYYCARKKSGTNYQTFFSSVKKTLVLNCSGDTFILEILLQTAFIHSLMLLETAVGLNKSVPLLCPRNSRVVNSWERNSWSLYRLLDRLAAQSHWGIMKANLQKRASGL